MADGEGRHLEAAESILKEAGFNVSLRCISRPSCFDFAASKGKAKIFIKIQRDIGSFDRNDARELREIAKNFSAACILIAHETREKPLEDDTVYTRYDVRAITVKTFENIVFHNIPPLIQARPGGYYVELDGEALKKRMLELGLSTGDMAEMVGTSRRTIYGYERGLTSASVASAYNMICALGVPIARAVNVFETSGTRHHRCILSTARRMFVRNKLLRRIFSKLSSCNVTSISKAPFDFLINSKDEKLKIIGGIAFDKETDISLRVSEILSVSTVVEAMPILVTGKHESPNKGIPCISSEEAARIRDPRDLFASI